MSPFYEGVTVGSPPLAGCTGFLVGKFVDSVFPVTKALPARDLRLVSVRLAPSQREHRFIPGEEKRVAACASKLRGKLPY
jgi:hypothetical protein